PGEPILERVVLRGAHPGNWDFAGCLGDGDVGGATARRIRAGLAWGAGEIIRSRRCVRDRRDQRDCRSVSRGWILQLWGAGGSRREPGEVGTLLGGGLRGGGIFRGVCISRVRPI